MALEPLQIVKNWFRNTRTREENWDELNRNILAYSVRTNNNLKQIGLDLCGSVYSFNNTGKSTINPSICSRLTLLESQDTIIGVKNLGLSLTDQGRIKLVSADGTDLSATNTGQVTFNSTVNPGQIKARDLEANLEVDLTGAHWGYAGSGDLTDVPLWVMLIDTGVSVELGVSVQAGRGFVSTSDDETVQTSVNSEEKVLVSSALSSDNNITYLGWVNANFDDTGNPNGENYWEVQNGRGDINIGDVPHLMFGELYF